MSADNNTAGPGLGNIPNPIIAEHLAQHERGNNMANGNSDQKRIAGIRKIAEMIQKGKQACATLEQLVTETARRVTLYHPSWRGEESATEFKRLVASAVCQPPSLIESGAGLMPSSGVTKPIPEDRRRQAVKELLRGNSDRDDDEDHYPAAMSLADPVETRRQEVVAELMANGRQHTPRG